MTEFVVAVDRGRSPGWHRVGSGVARGDDRTPDATDPATLGCA